MTTYGLTAISLTSNSYADLQFIDGKPYTHQNVAAIVNSSRGNSDATNCAFEQQASMHEPEHMPCDIDNYVVLVATRYLHVGDEFFVQITLRKEGFLIL